MSVPYKKMQNVRKLGFIAKCNCGHEHKFKGSEIDLDKSDKLTAIFKDIYTCPICNTQYDGISENMVNGHRKYSPIGILISVILVFGVFYGGYKIFFPTPIYTNIKDATNKQVNDFFKWDNQQQQQKRDNQPAFNSGK